MPDATPRLRSRRLVTAIVSVAAASTMVAATPTIRPQDASPADPTVASWSDAIWQAAIEDRMDEVERLLDRVPDHGGQAASRLRERVESRDRHADASDEDRGKERAEALEELDAELAAGDLSKALTAAVRIQTLSDDWAEVLDSERIAELIRQAEIAERDAEERGDFLLAQEILFRLRTLHEDVGRGEDYRRHNASLERVNRRIGLLAQYAPRALHDLRARQAARLAPEEEFPEFNPAFAEDWREQDPGDAHGRVRPHRQRRLASAARRGPRCAGDLRDDRGAGRDLPLAGRSGEGRGMEGGDRGESRTPRQGRGRRPDPSSRQAGSSARSCRRTVAPSTSRSRCSSASSATGPWTRSASGTRTSTPRSSGRSDTVDSSSRSRAASSAWAF
ncbi:MAG: hypothetical protein ACYTFH_04010 [Planctomycetota bacterium]|jgi:hypothetical protein